MEQEQFKLRYQLAKAKRAPFEGRLDLAYRFTSPMGSPFYNADTTPDRTRIYDDTVGLAVDKLATRMLNLAMPRDDRWIGLCVTDLHRKAMSGAVAAQEMMLATELSRFFDAVSSSDVYEVAWISMKDCIIAGVGALSVRARGGELEYRPVPVSELYFLDNGISDIDNVFHVTMLPVRTVIQMYSKVPDWVRELNEKDGSKQIKIIEAMTEGKRKGEYEWSVWTEQDYELLEQHSLKYKPFIVFRWERSSSSIWGEGPVLKALGNVESINEAMADHLDASALAARPPLQGPDELRDAILMAGKFYNNSNGRIEVIELNSRQSQMGMELIQHLQQAIRAQLYADILPQGSDRMTSTEVQLRHSDWYEMISGTSLRIEQELVRPLTLSTISVCGASGLMSKITFGGKSPIRLQMNSIEKRIQMQRDAMRVVQGLQTVAEMSIALSKAQNPELNQIIKMPETIRYVLKNLNIPAELLTDVQASKLQETIAHAATAIGGAQQIASGQGSADQAAQAGRSLGALIGTAQQPGAAPQQAA